MAPRQRRTRTQMGVASTFKRVKLNDLYSMLHHVYVLILL